MKTIALVFLCFYSAFADVNELLIKPEPLVELALQTEEVQPGQEQAELSNSVVPLEESVNQEQKCGEALVEEPAPASPLVLLNEAVEVIEAVEALPVAVAQVETAQLTATHPDYQAPYEYQTPKIQLDYVAPAEPEVVTEAVVIVELPTVKEAQPPAVQNEYLPPLTVAETLVKRHAKFGLKRKV
ncbi:uncharacterized protein LOC129771494 [Toxorhynchites rutilus septentrionalis]|uniref:uncharacterized protein LOC129771494 n=1 Tax=Toxorhynchites rutilus septentrionalis TaxID=329112 RepID=UPI002479255C|nr:uncharacterized protein LOC129771494 [Toxorhynchites rutilus septentrionalis]